MGTAKPADSDTGISTQPPGRARSEQSVEAQTAGSDGGASGSAARPDAGAGGAQARPDAAAKLPKAGSAAQPDPGRSVDAATSSGAAGTAGAAEMSDTGDAGKPREAATPQDAGVARDAAVPHDAGAPHDAAAPTSADAGHPDAAKGGSPVCAVAVTMNSYEGDPNYHGRLGLKNIGSSTWTLPTISFDLPSTAYVCNDPSDLPGVGWILRSSKGHCEFTKTLPALSIAPNATLLLEYSSDYIDTLPGPAVVNINVSSCD